MARGITIDEIPLDASIQWARGQDYATYPQEIKAAAALLASTQIAVADPSYDRLTLLFEQNKKAPPWAMFTPPHLLRLKSHRLFQHSIIQGVDPGALMELYHAHIDKLYEEQTTFCPLSFQKILSLFETLEELNQLLAEIRSKILRHQKS